MWFLDKLIRTEYQRIIRSGAGENNINNNNKILRFYFNSFLFSARNRSGV